MPLPTKIPQLMAGHTLARRTEGYDGCGGSTRGVRVHGPLERIGKEGQTRRILVARRWSRSEGGTGHWQRR